MSTQPLAIVLAAGKGTRMKSPLPKVLIEICGRPMIHYVLDALEAGGVQRTIVVVGYEAELVRRELSPRPGVEFALQEEQRGTGHAVMMCREQLAGHTGPVVVVAGDSPLLQATSIGKLLEHFQKESPACLLGTGHKDDPRGLGRIVRDANQAFAAIVEEKDATEEQRQITEVNLSTYVFAGTMLLEALDQLSCDNAQGEYYLTDCPAILLDAGHRVEALDVLQPCESLSINTVDELAAAEAELRRQLNHANEPG